MKNQNIVVIVIMFGFAFALASVTQAAPTPQGGPTVELAANTAAAMASSTSPEAVNAPIVTIHSAGNILRGKTGSFVLATQATAPAITASGVSGTFVNFKVSGTAVAGVDYVALVSPAFIAASGFGVISLKTLPDPRASFNRQAYSVVVTVEPGAGYAVGAPSSAQIWIKP